MVSSSQTNGVQENVSGSMTSAMSVGRAKKVLAVLEPLVAEGGRVWLVTKHAREDPPPRLDQWLWRHAVRMKRTKHRRFDYHEHIVDVHLIGGDEPPGPRQAATAP